MTKQRKTALQKKGMTSKKAGRVAGKIERTSKKGKR